MPTAQEQVLDFWFQELPPQQWFVKDEQVDHKITEKYLALHQRAAQGELWLWRQTAEGCLAEIIVLDQFSRNIYRDKAAAFATDAMALCLAQNAIAQGFDESLEPTQKAFLYMPYMHSESRQIHEQAMQLFDQEGLEYNLEFEIKHKAIIDRFGRYPHRNAILGRDSTEEEVAFLQEPGSSF